MNHFLHLSFLSIILYTFAFRPQKDTLIFEKGEKNYEKPLSTKKFHGFVHTTKNINLVSPLTRYQKIFLFLVTNMLIKILFIIFYFFIELEITFCILILIYKLNFLIFLSIRVKKIERRYKLSSFYLIHLF